MSSSSSSSPPFGGSCSCSADATGSRGRHRARRFPRRGGDGESERLHRGSSQPRVSRRGGGGGRNGRVRAPRAPADGEGEEFTTRARAGDALEQRRERLARGAPAVGVLVRAQSRDHGDEEERRVRLDRLRGKSRDDVPEAVHGAQSPGGVLILQVGGERLEVLLKSPLAERIVQQELYQRLRAQLAVSAAFARTMKLETVFMQSYISGRSGRLASTARISEKVVDRCSSRGPPLNLRKRSVMNLN